MRRARFWVVLFLGIFLHSFALAQDAGAPAMDGGTPITDAAVPVQHFRIAPAGPRAVVAREDGAPPISPLVTAREVVDAIASYEPAMREHFSTRAGLEEAVRRVVRARVLADAARREGLENDPAVKREIELALERVFIERHLAMDPPSHITNEQIKAYYEAHSEDFVRPEKVHVLAIVLDDEDTAKHIATLTANATEARFRELARAHSLDRRSRARRGDFGWITRGMNADLSILETALNLRARGETTHDPISTADGRFVILRLIERAPPEPIALDEVRGTIASRMRREALDAAVERLYRGVASERGVVVAPIDNVFSLTPREPAAP